jgi:RimJ/RimL family protein N-acetyltransferase
MILSFVFSLSVRYASPISLGMSGITRNPANRGKLPRFDGWINEIILVRCVLVVLLVKLQVMGPSMRPITKVCGRDGMRQIVCESDRLALVAPSVSDIEPLCVLWGDPETMRYIGSGDAWSCDKVTQRIERAMRMHQEQGMTFWTVIEKESGEVIGQGGLVPIEFDGPEIELGYRLGKASWGKGYATEIAKMSAAHGFETMGVDELVAVCDPANLGSRRVLIKTGFAEVGESDVYYGVPTIVHRMSKDGMPGIR